MKTTVSETYPLKHIHEPLLASGRNRAALAAVLLYFLPQRLALMIHSLHDDVDTVLRLAEFRRLHHLTKDSL